MLVELTPAQIAILETLINERSANGAAISNSTLQSALLSNNASWKSNPEVQTVTFAGTSLGFERRGRYNYVTASGETKTATVDTIVNTGTAAFAEFDQVTIRPAQGKLLSMAIPGQPKTILLSDPTHYITLGLADGAWGLVASNPPAASSWVMPSVAVDATTATLAMIGDSAIVRYLTGETPATGTVTITASGASGTVSAYVDEGYGADLIGSYTYAGTPGNNAVAAGLAADINARYLVGQSLYDATAALAVVTIIPPQGKGALANTYVISTADSGSATSVAAGFSGGVNGAEASGTIELIQAAAQDGTIIRITNGNSAYPITFDGPAVPGSNIATTKTLQPYESSLFIYSDALAAWSGFV